jgi:hypothetical protein
VDRAVAQLQQSTTSGSFAIGSRDGDTVHNWGVVVNFASTIRSGGSGSVTVEGTAGAGTDDNIGVFLGNSSTITSVGNGLVTVKGTSTATAGGGNHGILFGSSNPSTISSGGGTVQVTGIGGAGTTNNNGVVMLSVSATITSGVGGAVFVEGTAGGGATNSQGVWLFPGSQITSGGGDVHVTGNEGGNPNSIGLAVLNGATITTVANGGAMTLISDSMLFAAASDIAASSTSSVTLRQRSNGVAISLGSGSNPSGGPLGLTDAELDRVIAGTINIGNADTGTITLSGPITRTAATNLNLTTGAATGVRPTASGTDLNLAGGALAISSGSDLIINIGGLAVDTGYNQLKVTGDVNLNGLDLTLSGGFTSSSGDVFTIVSAPSVSGTFNGLPENAIVPLNGRSLRVNYTATTVTLTDTPNSPPTIAHDQASVTADEGSTAANTGTFSDTEGNNTVNLTASIGTVTKNDANGTWSWSYLAGDGPDGPTTVTITATDDFNEIATTTFTLTVTNVAPTATISNNGPVAYGDSFTVSLGSPSDPSSADTTAGFRYAFNLTGDFTGVTYATGSSTPSQSFAQNAGTYTVHARIIDKDGDFTDYSTTVTVTQATLTGDAATQDALNMAKQGKLNITVTNIEGFVNGENAEVFLTNASFWIVIDSLKYEFVPTSVTKLSDSSIAISYSLKNSNLLETFGDALDGATSAKTAVEAGFSMESANYSLSDDYLTRLFSTVK